MFIDGDGVRASRHVPKPKDIRSGSVASSFDIAFPVDGYFANPFAPSPLIPRRWRSVGVWEVVWSPKLFPF